jgi:RimJ/RimL family protein N-acetyltransferase
MLKMREADFEHARREWEFIKEMPADENGMTNPWAGLSEEEFLKDGLTQMMSYAKGENLPEGYVPETFYFLYDDEEIVGHFRIRHYLTEALRKGAGHIGYCIGRNWWHQGYTSEALQALLDFFFDEVGVNRVETRHDSRNPHSGGVMRKCGMHCEGVLRQSDWNNQGICDAVWYGILASERGKTCDK